MNDQPSRRATLVTLTLTTLGFSLLLVPDALCIMMLPMVFDSGVSTLAVVFVLTLLTYPLVVLASIPSSWIAYRMKAYRAAIGFGLLPAINVIVVAAMLAVS